MRRTSLRITENQLRYEIRQILKEEKMAESGALMQQLKQYGKAALLGVAFYLSGCNKDANIPVDTNNPVSTLQQFSQETDIDVAETCSELMSKVGNQKDAEEYRQICDTLIQAQNFNNSKGAQTLRRLGDSGKFNY